MAHCVYWALGFMVACGLKLDNPMMSTTKFWTSHEIFLLPYEEAFTCEDCTLELFYDYSRLMSTLVSLMEHTLSFFVEFLILGNQGLSSICNKKFPLVYWAHFWLDEVFNGISVVLWWNQGFQLKPFQNVNMW